MSSTISDSYKNAPVVLQARDRVLALKGRKYSDIISKNPAAQTPDGSVVEELQWVDLVTAGDHKKQISPSNTSIIIY